jgi:two-component system cell cycle sensor histidine kinase/response regulator CckA
MGSADGASGRVAGSAGDDVAVLCREIVENVPQVFYVADERGHLLYVSPAFQAVSGYPVERLHANPAGWFELIHVEDRARVADAMARSRGQGHYEIEYRVLRADGAVRWLAARGTELRGPDGRVQRIVGVATDVTQRRLLEEQLRHAQKMEAVGQLASGIAHDFNNLLGVILANAGLLREQLGAEGEAAQQIAEVEAAARRAAELTKKLLGFSRQAVLALRPIALGDVVREVAGLLRHTLDPRVEVRVKCTPGGDVVLADPTELVHVVMNLCLNARDAMPRGGLLTLETGRSVIDAAHAARVPGGRVGEVTYLSVADTGAGMSADVVPHIFEPFFTTKPAGKGTGLGLAVAFGIVQQHQGFIECSTSPGVGTRFTIFLAPQEGAPVARAPAAPSGAAVAGRGETILFVDDEEPLRRVARAILEQHGYRVRLAANGAEALAAYERDAAGTDLVVVDLTMPGLTGIEVVRRLRRMRPDVRVILSTGHLGEEGRLAEQAGPLDVLPKPYAPDALARLVHDALTRR